MWFSLSHVATGRWDPTSLTDLFIQCVSKVNTDFSTSRPLLEFINIIHSVTLTEKKNPFNCSVPLGHTPNPVNFTWGLGHSCTLPGRAVLRWAQAVTMFSVPCLCSSVALCFMWNAGMLLVWKAAGFIIWKRRRRAHFFLPMQNMSSCQVTMEAPSPTVPSFLIHLSSILPAQPFGAGQSFAVQWIRHTLSYLPADADFLTAPEMPSPPTHTSWQVLSGLRRTLDTTFSQSSISPNPLAGIHPPAPPQTQASFHPVPRDRCILQ